LYILLSFLISILVIFYSIFFTSICPLYFFFFPDVFLICMVASPHDINRTPLSLPVLVFVFFLPGKNGFVMPTKSFVKIGITKLFCYNNEMFSSINKTFGCCSKIFG